MERLDHIPELQTSCVALGFFDAIHLGHQAVIRAAFSGEGTNVVLSVGYKGADNTLLLTREERCRQLEELGTQMYIQPDFAPIKGMTGEKFVRDILHGKLHARRVACGVNYRFGAGAALGIEDMMQLCGRYGIECEAVELVELDGEIVSTSAVCAALADGRVDSARQMLGRRYGYSLPVVDGQHLGRSFGTPTINQALSQVCLPKFGVYASLTFAGGRWYDSVTNIGVKPTVGQYDPTSETWMRGFAGDLYGRTIRVELVEFIRPECRFGSLDDLKAQILQDGKKALEITGEISQNLNRTKPVSM